MAAAGSHPGLVRYYGAWTERAGEGRQHFYLQLELCGESLDDVRRSRLDEHFPEAQLVDILRQARMPVLVPTAGDNFLQSVVGQLLLLGA